MTLKLKGQLQITSALHYRILPYCQSSRLNTHSARKVDAFCKQASKKVASTSLRPLIDTCQKCSTSPANHEPRSPANGGFQNPGVCPQAVPSFLSPTPTVLFFGSRPIFSAGKIPKIPFLGLSLLPNSTETLATQARFSHTDRLSSVNKMFIIWQKQEQFNSFQVTGLY